MPHEKHYAGLQPSPPRGEGKGEGFAGTSENEKAPHPDPLPPGEEGSKISSQSQITNLKSQISSTLSPREGRERGRETPMERYSK
jgi:hypothetical protein